ncbi:unnamed protein product [Aphanomyces euteiches]
MNHQPLICKLLFDRGILPLILAMLHSNPQLQLQALRTLKHLLSCPVDIATQTMTQMRLSGALINICWLFTFLNDPKVNRAASDVLESLIKRTPEVGKRLIEDLCEQGCVLLLQQKPTRHYQWVLNNFDQESLNLLLTTLARTKNSLLRSNLLVSVLVLAASSKTKQLQLDEWWPTLLSLMADPNVLNHLLIALVTLCNPETIPQRVSSNTQRPFDGPLRLKWSDEEYIVSKSAMAHNSHTIHSKLLKEPTCTALNMPAMSSPCKKSFQLVCQLSSPKLAGLEQTVLVELASVAQKLGMQSLLNATIDQLKVAHLPVNFLQQEEVVRIPVIILHWLNYLLEARKALENDERDFLILARFVLISIACALFPAYLYAFYRESDNGISMATKLGFKDDVVETLTTSLSVLVLTMLLFAGSIFSNALEIRCIKKHEKTTWRGAFQQTHLYRMLVIEKMPTMRTLIFVRHR